MLNENISENDPRIIGSPPARKQIYNPSKSNQLSFGMMSKSILHKQIEEQSNHSGTRSIISNNSPKDKEKKYIYIYIYRLIQTGDGGAPLSSPNIDSHKVSRNNSGGAQKEETIAEIEEEERKEEKISPRERWKKAIRKVMFMNKFSNLNKEIKAENKLFGRTQTQGYKKPPPKTKCVSNYLFKLLLSIYICV